ncbi:R-spondin-1 [Polyodon spathula]|uniref:R-spondin-1 n=1 Tax=Polyodon spathula TaxID=7913 RepID=UPI001B7E35A8|nr:R-spondin-1 [Polyodon spathula]
MIQKGGDQRSHSNIWRSVFAEFKYDMMKECVVVEVVVLLEIELSNYVPSTQQILDKANDYTQELNGKCQRAAVPDAEEQSPEPAGKPCMTHLAHSLLLVRFEPHTVFNTIQYSFIFVLFFSFLLVSTEVTPVCPKGCELCSEYNGCLKCLPKLFILLERNDIRQIGICLPSCPVGYFGVRNPEMNKCTKCKIDNCEACFSRNFCTKCKEGLFLHKGRCYSSCPEGFAALNGTMECSSVVQCELGEWGSWGPCTKKGKLCGFKKGSQNRTREALQPPPAEPSLCPPETESRTCTVQKKPCAKGGKNKKEKKEEQGNNKDNGRNRNNKETKEGKPGSSKRRKGQQRGTAAPTTTPSVTQ